MQSQSVGTVRRQRLFSQAIQGVDHQSEPLVSPDTESRRGDASHETPPSRTASPSILRSLYLLGGIICVGLGAIGVIIPGLPTTPFLLVASWCFSKSSRRFETALLNSRLFGPLLQDWRRHKAVRRSVKNLAAGMVITMIAATCVFASLSVVVKASIVGMGLVGMLVILRLPVLNH